MSSRPAPSGVTKPGQSLRTVLAVPTTPLAASLAASRATLLCVLSVTGYFALQSALRLASGPGLEFDEAEALWYARTLQAGYNAQPPLYFWLQNLALKLPLPPIAALVLMKNAIFAAAVLAVFFLCRRIDRSAAPAAMLSLGLLPEIVWEMQRDRTHTVLLLLLSVLATLAMLQARRNPANKTAAQTGLLFGLGILSKPNFAFLAGGLIVAAWPTSRRTLPRLGTRHIGLVLAVALAIVAPWAIWAATHPELAGASLHKLRLSGESALLRRLDGVGSFATALVALLGAAGLVLGTLWATLRPGPVRDDTSRYLILAALASLGLALATVLVAGASQTQSRWLLPLVFLLPPLVTMHLWRQMTPQAARRLTAGLALPWLVVLVALPFANRSAVRQADFAGFDSALPAGLPLVSSQTILLGNLVNIASARPLYLLAAGSAAPDAGTEVVLIEPKGGLADAARMGYVIAQDSLRTIEVTHGTQTRRYDMATALTP